MEFQSTREDQKSLSLTVYTNGFGLVKHKRQIRTDAKIGEIRFADVADQVDMDSIVIHGIDVLEHSYDYNLVSKRKLLEKYIGQVVTIRNHGEGHEVEVRLVSVSDGLIEELESIGEDAIEHTPLEGKLKFHIGEAYDIVTASREKKRGQRGSFEYVMIEYDLKNHKEENIRVDIEHFIYDRLWKLETSSHDYEIINSSKVEFCARIAAGKTAKVEFTYKIDKRHGT